VEGNYTWDDRFATLRTRTIELIGARRLGVAS
jgi:hypothetical protein